MNAPNGLHTYDYDNIYQLLAVSGAQAHTYTYDAAGNRINTDGIGYSPNVLNQYSQVGGINYGYDNNGSMTGNGAQTYGYDNENRLNSVTASGLNASYVYDGLGRRVSKTVGGVTTAFVYDGDRVIEERNSSGTAVIATYVYGVGLDEVLSMDRNSAKYYYLYDGLGSVVNLTNASGQILETYSYDPYGKPAAASSLGNPYLFTGQRYDVETGLYYYKTRYYNSNIGRFLQRDVIGYLGGINLYVYVGNSPINRKDPYGLLNPEGQWPFYTKKDYEDGKEQLKKEIQKKSPWMQDKDVDKLADDIMKEMTISEAKKIQDLEK
jgi:RHS repeat-associated protein